MSVLGGCFVVDSLCMVSLVVTDVCIWSLFYDVVLRVISTIANTLLRKSGPVALLYLCSYPLMDVL